MKINFLAILLIGLIEFINSLIYIFMYKGYSKKCNYDCSKCKIWDCPAHYCNEKRLKNEIN